MAIDTTGKWWTGSDPTDLRAYLVALVEQDTDHRVDQFRLAKCSCGATTFTLRADRTEGAAERVCGECKARHLICDSAESWQDARPRKWRCGECKHPVCNVGVGFSLTESREAIRWLYVGVRCAMCGVLGCFVDWKIAYEPSLQLMDQV